MYIYIYTHVYIYIYNMYIYICIYIYGLAFRGLSLMTLKPMAYAETVKGW